MDNPKIVDYMRAHELEEGFFLFSTCVVVVVHKLCSGLMSLTLLDLSYFYYDVFTLTIRLDM